MMRSEVETNPKSLLQYGISNTGNQILPGKAVGSESEIDSSKKPVNKSFENSGHLHRAQKYYSFQSI